LADFQGVDFLHLDELLSEEELLARVSVRSFVRKEFLPLIQRHVRQDVYMLTEITKAQLLALRVGRLKDEGRLEHVMVSMIKRNNVDSALEIARKVRDLLGANGIVDDYCAMRHMLNLETVRSYEGTHDMHMLILGEHVTGLRAI
jgi:glutaryl-CoA dehydrogenase